MKRAIPILLGLGAVLLTSCIPDGPHSEVLENDRPVAGMTFAQGNEPFKEHIFRFTGTGGEYLVTVSPDDDGLTIGIEDKDYERTTTHISPPEGYRVYLPDLQSDHAAAVNVISNDLTDEEMPGIMQFTFLLSDGPVSSPKVISRFYTIDGSGLRDIEIFDTTQEKGERSHLEYLDRVQLNHTEPDKFIYEISVDDTDIYDDQGHFIPIEDRVKIKLLVFDKRSLTMKIVCREIRESDPLYFGYAYWAAANTAAQYFTVSLLPDTDYTSGTPTDDGTYYTVQSERFRTLADLYMYLLTVFSEDRAAELYREAPQGYRDIDGRLCTRDMVMTPDKTLGTLTFTDMYITDTTMLFYSRQVKTDSDGNVTGYTDGGNFIISCRESDEWLVTDYRYPY
ncbi:MAG: hypothetical protein IKR73_10015 [Oscillospiraceae bacterium]|nr:hypothetical protein [Oscillospiraceae bacterium]